MLFRSFCEDEECYRTGAFANGQVVSIDGEVVQRTLIEGALLRRVAGRIGRRAGALEGVDEAGAEVELLAQRHQRVGAGRPDDGDSRLLGHLAAGHGQRGTVGPDDRVDLVVLDQPRDRVRRLDFVGLSSTS